MVALISGDDVNQQLAEWAAMNIPHVGEAGFGPCVAIGIATGTEASDELYGVFIAHDWQPAARVLQVSMAARSPKWVWGCRPLFRYMFEQVKAFKIFTAIPHDNERALRYNAGIGLKKEAVLRHQFGPGRHGVIYSMLEFEYRHSRWCNVPALQSKAA
jgi:hypothetical protein